MSATGTGVHIYGDPQLHTASYRATSPDKPEWQIVMISRDPGWFLRSACQLGPGVLNLNGSTMCNGSEVELHAVSTAVRVEPSVATTWPPSSTIDNTPFFDWTR